ncbi:MAG: hypothetical protein JSV05_01905 [Candidatus Bathyarchaeota archaeon]|nr:MAG: hypothetical protein JSV05_01905 [Candidatus Bathyarchaeota archaeon]
MFEGEKNIVFFGGLFIFGSALCGLFLTLWVILIDTSHNIWKIVTPFVFASVVFLLIGYYLMTIGVKKPPPPPKS